MATKKVIVSRALTKEEAAELKGFVTTSLAKPDVPKDGNTSVLRAMIKEFVKIWYADRDMAPVQLTVSGSRRDGFWVDVGHLLSVSKPDTSGKE